MFDDTSSCFTPSSQPRNPVVDTELMDLLDDRVETRKSAKTDYPIMKCFVISYSFPLRIDRSVRGRVKMPEDIKYDCQVLIKSKVTRYFDIFPWYLVDIFTKKSKILFLFCTSVSGIKWIDQILMIFESDLGDWILTKKETSTSVRFPWNP